MATNEGSGIGRSGEPRRPATSSVGGSNKPSGTSKRDGETVPGSGGGPTELPEQFGRYRIKKMLGGGGMGAVYLAIDTDLDREVALKVPHFGTGTDPDVLERFLREAKSAAKLDHPNLCQVYDVGVLDGIYYLTMRYLKGFLLSDFAGRPQPFRKTVELVAKLAQALDCAHAKNVIHRDLKPANVMMCPGTGPTIMDFGLAKQTQQQDQKLTQRGTILGTPAYMPPEQLQGNLDKMGPASDVYSLGVMLFELLTGRLPFESDATPELYGKILYTEAPLPSYLRPDVPPALDAICVKALAKAPEKRYVSMKALGADLIEFLKVLPVGEGGGPLLPNTPTTAPANRADVLAAQTLSPAGGQAGRANILAAQTMAPTGGPVNRADVLAAQTIAPGSALADIVPPRPKGASVKVPPPPPTQAIGKQRSSVRKPASVVKTPLKAEPEPEPEERGSSNAVVWVLCGLLMVLGVGGIGGLAYVLMRNKSAEASPTEVAKVENKDKKDLDKPQAIEKGPTGKDPDKAPLPPEVKDEGTGGKTKPKEEDPPPPSADPPVGEAVVEAGSIWKGDHSAPMFRGATNPVQMTVESREGNTIRGRLRWSGSRPTSISFTGKVEGNKVSWKTHAPRQGVAPISNFTGTVNGDTMQGEWTVPPRLKGTFRYNKLSGFSESTSPPVVTSDEPKGTVLLAEDFKKVDKGSRPKDWEGDAFSVLEKDGRVCLLVNNTKPEVHYLTLPKLPLKGDFVVDCEFRLGGRSPFSPFPGDHEFHLELSGGSSSPVKVVVNHLAQVKLDSSQLMKSEDFKPFGDIRFRLMRKKDVYTVSINGKVTTGLTIRGKGAFEEIRLGLTGGERNRVVARLYSVKVLSLGGDTVASTPPTPPKEENKDDPLEVLRKGQDFKAVTAGTLPKGWKGDDTVICVQKNAGQPGLVLMAGAGGVTILPAVKLDAGFWMESELAIPDSNNGLVALQFDIAPKRFFLVEVNGRGVIRVQAKIVLDGSKVWKRSGQLNKLTMERGKENFVIKVNDTEVGSVPLRLASGTFNSVRLGLQFNPKGLRSQSPRIHSVRLVPGKAGE